MMTLNEGTIYLYTYKDGLLSRLGHDLRLSVARFEFTVDELKVKARFWPDSIKVDGVMNGERFDAEGLSAKDKRDVYDHTMKKVLNVRKHPDASLEGAVELDGDKLRFSGSLKLAGKQSNFAIDLRSEESRIRGKVTIAPTKWGIAPFKALLGALRIKDIVDIEVDLPDPRSM